MGVIYLDSCLLIYAIERDEQFGDQVIATLDDNSEQIFAISPLVKLECLVKPLALTNTELKNYYEAAFETLELLSMTDEVFTEAAMLRARFNIKTPDALHLSCAQIHRCSSLWTNDARLAKASHGLSVNILNS